MLFRSGNSGDISVTYTLADADSDACSITPEYSTDNGINWFPTFSITGSLTNVTPGAGKTFTWRSADDFLSTYSQVRLRLTPNDGVANGTPGMTTAFAVANNSLPSITNVTTSGTAGAITVNFDLADAENNPCSVALHYSLNGGVSYSQSTFISGQTSNVLPGAGNVIVWESSNNVTTNVADVRVRLVPNDGTGNGTAGVSSAFSLNNDTNAAPAITALSRTGTTGNITFTYTLADANGDACSIKLYYSTDSGTTYYQSSSISGATTGVLPGSGRNLVWNSVADVNSTVNGVLVKLVPQDARAEGTSMTSAAFNVTNNTLPVVSSVSVTGDSGPISVSYTLADSNTDPCNVTVSYSIDGGLTFNPTSNISGTVTGVAPGSNRSLTWNSAADINGNQTGVRIRISASDPFGAGTSGETVSFTVNNNKLPVVSSVTTSGTSGNITITYNLNDENGHTSSIQVFYSIDGGVTYLPTDDLSGTTTNIATGTGKTIVWNSALAINRNQTGVRVRVVPSDPYGAGTGGNSASFNVLNNQAPVISAITPTGTTGNVVITYTLADANDNPCSVLFYYSTNNGTTYTLSTNVTGQTSALSPGSGKVLTWNSTADINTDNATVKVRLVANDGVVSGTPADSATISILNNRAPIVSNVRNSGTTGDITITYDLEDANSNPSSLSLAYTIDNGTTYTAIAAGNITGLTSGITPGSNRTVTWNSAANITGNAASVRVRLIANDGLTNSAAAETAGFAVTNNNLPIAKNVAWVAGTSGNISIQYDLEDTNLNNCSMTVYYSLDNGVTYAQVNPANLSGDVSGVAPGTSKGIVWSSATEVPGSSSQVKIKVLPNDGTGNGTPGETSAFTVSNNSAPAVSAVTTSVVGSTVTINYTLADANSDACSIVVYYSTDGGTTYASTTFLTGTTTGIAPGARTIDWNSANDFKSNSGNIRVKIEPNDGKVAGVPGISSTFALSNNTMPVVTNLAVGGSAGAITIGYDLADAEQNACSIEVYYSTNGGITYTRTTNLTGLTSNLAPATGRSITWNSGDNFTGKSTAVYVRVVANDGFGNGTPGVSGPFTVNNNSVPVISSLVTTGSSGDITLSFNLADANSHTCDLSVDYSLDGGTTWASATGITGTLVGVTPGTGRTLVWASRGTFVNNQANVRLRITPSDPYETGVAVPTSAFAVNNNRAPSISNIVVSGTSGNISVSYSLADLDNNACGVTVAQSVNGGPFNVTANVSGSVSSVSPGNGINLVWNSVADAITFSSNVRLRLTPNDGIVAGTAVDSAVFTVNNVNELPTISNISITQAGKVATFTFDLADANNDQCSVAVAYSLDNGSTWQTANNVVGDLASVLPGTGRRVTWRNYPDIDTLQSNVKVRLLPNDTKANGNAGITSTFVIDNSPPVISNVRATRRGDNDYDVLYDLAYPSAEPGCDVGVYYTTDDGTTWTHSASATAVVAGNDKSLIWSATTDLPGPTYYTAKLELRPLDSSIIGVASQSVAFPVNNTSAPVLSGATLVSEDPVAGNYRGNQKIGFTITDADLSNSFSMTIEYTINNGVSWAPITSNVPLTNLPAGANEIIWESYRDFVNSSAQTRLRLKCSDGDLVSSEVLVPGGLFTLNNVHKPDIIRQFIDVDSSGNYTNAALSSDGFVYVWGQMAATGYYVGDSTAHSVPTLITGGNWPPIIDVACTGQGLLVLGNDQTIRCVGYSSYGEFGNGTTGANYSPASNIKPTGLDGQIKAISCSYAHTLALHEDGTVRAFGYNTSYGALGDGTFTNRSSPVTVLGGLSNVKAIAAGGYSTVGFSLALTNAGEVYSWGYNGQGQLGHGDTASRNLPAKIPGLTGVKAIAAGANHSLFLLENGKIFYCGNDGVNTAAGNVPVEVISPLLVDIQKIFAGQSANSQGCSFAVNSRGEVFAWGNNATYGIFGLNNVTNQASPVKIPGISSISAIAVAKTGNKWSTFVSNAATGNSGIWNAGYGASYYQMSNTNTTANYFYHP